MAELVADCPRCGSRHITFDVTAAKPYRIDYGWQQWYEAFGICRHCGRTTIFVLSESVSANYDHVHKVGLLEVKGSLNNYVDIEGHVSLQHDSPVVLTEVVPSDVLTP